MTDTTTIERSIVIDAPAADVAPHLTDFHNWVAWSPWEGQDDALKRTYTGDPGSVGASYAWDGNRKAGAGTMRITGITPAEVDVDLAFSRPFKSTSTVEFRLVETAGTTTVVWTMLSPKTTMSRIMGRFINMDKMLGGQFVEGLTKLKAVVEG